MVHNNVNSLGASLIFSKETFFFFTRPQKVEHYVPFNNRPRKWQSDWFHLQMLVCNSFPFRNNQQWNMVIVVWHFSYCCVTFATDVLCSYCELMPDHIRPNLKLCIWWFHLETRNNCYSQACIISAVAIFISFLFSNNEYGVLGVRILCKSSQSWRVDSLTDKSSIDRPGDYLMDTLDTFRFGHQF